MMMTARCLALVICLFLAGIAPALSGTKESPVIVDLRAHRGEIRAALLQHTPVGSSVKAVMNFISQQLQRAPGTSAVAIEPVKDDSQPRATKTIRIYLGQYYDHPEVVFLSTPLMMQREVTAQWLFDSHDQLIDVAVKKQNGLY